MNQPNLPAFEEPSPTIQGALRALSSNKITAPSYLDVVRKIGSALMTSPGGRVIIVAVPNAPVASWVCDSLQDLYAEKKRATGSSGTIAVLDLPQAFTRKEREQAILAAYTGTPMSVLQRKYPPRFDLEFTAPYFGPSPTNQICSIVFSQSPECYVISNAHELSEAGFNIYETIERVKFFIDIARQSGKTHVLVANAPAVANWMQSAEISSAVHQYWVKPYPRKGPSFIEFKGILSGFDRIVPRQNGFSLVSKATEIHQAVWGCPNRVKMWLERTLNDAVDDAPDGIDWQYLLARSPSKTDIDHAKAEFILIQNATHQPLRAAFADGGEGAAEVEKPKPKTKPGQRKLGRDPVAQPDAADSNAA